MSSVSPRSNGLDTLSPFSPTQPSSQNTIGDFIIGDKLGEGTFSKVCQGTHKTTKEKVAIKIMSKAQIKEPSDKIRIEKEINIQKRLHHNSIIQQYSIIETQTTIYIITEYCSGGELFDYIVSKRKLFEVEACRIFQQLISGLEYLHKQRIVHRDLKPENLLFDSKRNLKIADFGLSNEYKGKLSTPCGSPCYAAPEMVTGKKYNGSSVDIWSSGIVLYTMVCGYLPFEDENQNILFGKIAKGCFSLPTYLSPPCKDLLRKILVTDPNIRYGFEQIKHHPWFTSVNNVMGKNIFFNSPGIFINEDVIPIDENIVIELHEKFKYDLRNIISDLIRNKHNNITTSYYLVLKRKVRLCEKSISDISPNSELFLAYIKKQISKMSHWNNDVEKIIDYYYKQVYNILNATNALDRNKNEDVSSINESEQIEILPTVNLNTITNLHFLNENECVGPTKSNGGYNVDGCNCNSNNNSEDNSNVNSNNKIDEIIINTQTTRSQQHQPRNAHNTPIDKSINHNDKNNLKSNSNNNPKTCRTNSLPKEYQQHKRVDIQMNFPFMNFDPAQSMKINHIKNSNSNKDIHNKNKNSRNISQEIPITCQKVLQTDNTPICSSNNNNNKQNMNISSNKKQFGIDIYPNNNNNISNKNKQQLSSRKPNAMSITYNQPTIIKLSKPIYQNYKKKPVLPMSTQISKFINKKSPPPKGDVSLYNKTKHIKLITEPNGLEKDNIIQQDAIMSTEPAPYVKVNGSSNNKHHSSSLEHYKPSIRKLPLKQQQVKASEKKRPKSIEEYRLNTEIPVSSSTNTKTHTNNNNNNNSNSIKLTLPKKIVARNTRYNNTNYNNTSNNNNNNNNHKQITHNQQQQRKIKNNSVDDRDKNTFYHQLNTCEVYKKVPPKQNGAHVFNNTNIHRFSNNNSLNKNKLHSNNNNNNDIHIQTTSNSVERKRYLNTSVIHIKDDNPTPLLEKKIDLIVKKRNNKILFPSHNRANHYSQEHVPKNSIDITCPTNNGNSFILLQINNDKKSRANSNNTTLKKHKKSNASSSIHTNNNNNHNHHNIITSTGCNNNTHGSTARNYKNMNKLKKFVNVPSNRKNDSNNIHHKALTLPKNSYKENALLKEKELIINQNQNAYTICCKGTIDSIKDVIEDIIENKVTVNKIRNEKYLFICKCAGNNTKINNLLFELDVKRYNEVKEYFLINANMKNGVHKEYEAKVDKIKRRLLMENNNV